MKSVPYCSPPMEKAPPLLHPLAFILQARVPQTGSCKPGSCKSGGKRYNSGESLLIMRIPTDHPAPDERMEIVMPQRRSHVATLSFRSAASSFFAAFFVLAAALALFSPQLLHAQSRASSPPSLGLVTAARPRPTSSATAAPPPAPPSTAKTPLSIAPATSTWPTLTMPASAWSTPRPASSLPSPAPEPGATPATTAPPPAPN